MRIVFVVPDFEPLAGGTTRQAGYQARELISQGHEVVLVTRRRTKSMAKNEVLTGLPVVRIGLGGWSGVAEKLALLELAWWLRRRRSQVDVVQVLMQGDVATSARLAGVARRTWITWAGLGDATDLLRRPERPGPRRAQWAFRRGALRMCRHIALSQPLVDELRRGGLDVAAEIPVPIDLETFRPPSPGERAAARAAAGLVDDELVVVFVGHLRRLKAVDRLVTAFAALHETVGPSRLLLIGPARGASDDTEPELRQQVAAAGLDDRITFVGPVGDVRSYLWAGDVFVLPSEREGMPNALLEAMACGIPCVAPASAGGDVLLGDGAGIVPPSNDPADLLVALVTLQDPDERAAVRARALERMARHDVARVVTQYAEQYSEQHANPGG